MAKLIDGKVISAAVKDKVAKGVRELKEQGISVGLAVIIVGDDPASKVYVANKKKACEALGIVSEEYALPESTTEEELLALVDKSSMAFLFLSSSLKLLFGAENLSINDKITKIFIHFDASSFLFNFFTK